MDTVEGDIYVDLDMLDVGVSWSTALHNLLKKRLENGGLAETHQLKHWKTERVEFDGGPMTRRKRLVLSYVLEEKAKAGS